MQVHRDRRLRAELNPSKDQSLPLWTLHASGKLCLDEWFGLDSCDCRLQVGANYMLLNGQFVDVADLDVFSLLDRVRQEVRRSSMQTVSQKGETPQGQHTARKPTRQGLGFKV